MRVLVVDESPIARSVIRDELREGGYVVDEAGSAKETFERVQQRRPDLITLGVQLPDSDGFEICMKLRSGSFAPEVAEIPVVFVTASDTLEGRVRGFEVGGADFVTKGESQGEILAAINRILRPNQQLRGLTAVLVEDSEISRALLRQHLVEYGVRVLEARDGDEGLNLISQQPNDIDIIITDMRMPKMNGDELCEQVRTRLGLKHVPVIIVSVVDDLKSILDVFKVGATDYIMKPYIKEELIARLNSHLEVQMLNRRLNERVNELRRLNKLKDKFLTVCSENLRPPVVNIGTTIDEVLAATSPTEPSAKLLRGVKTQAKHVLSLIEQLLGEP